MLKKVSRNDGRMCRHVRVRTKINDTPECPCLNVFRSNSNIHAQIIDDVNGVTLVPASSVELKLESGGNVEAAKTVGTEIAKCTVEKNITGVVFDRGGYVHIGRVKASAEVVRAVGSKFQEVMRMGRRLRRNRDAEKELEGYVVTVNRITKIAKDGRRSRFAALVVIGDKKGRVDFDTGKVNEVLDAIKKVTGDAKKNVFIVPVVGTTIPYAVTGRYGAGEVFPRPTSEGTGAIAGGPVRTVLELVGINDTLSKCLGNRTSINMVRATISAPKDLKTTEEVARPCGKKPGEICG